MTTAQEYQATSATLLDQAHLELETGDLIQASEKYWGAAAQALKAVAQTRGWDHTSHAHFYRIVRKLIDESGNDELFDLFNAANLTPLQFLRELDGSDRNPTPLHPSSPTNRRNCRIALSLRAKHMGTQRRRPCHQPRTLLV